MKLGAVFSEDRKYRYRLWRIWNFNQPPLAWIMLNPSTADETKDDPTIKRCIGYSMNLGFGGCQIFNLFGWRSTYPVDLRSALDPVGPLNDGVIFSGCEKLKIICAWGNVWKDLAWRAKAVTDLLAGADLNYLKLNGSGYPAHPLYLHSKLTPTKWV
jgi:hypothetical protein